MRIILHISFHLNLLNQHDENIILCAHTSEYKIAEDIYTQRSYCN